MPLVERVAALSPERFRIDFEHVERPVVLVGGAKGLKACSWTAQSLADKLGHVTVRYKLSKRHLHPNFHETSLCDMFARESATLGEFLHDITKGPPEARSHKLFTGDEQFLLQRRNGQTLKNEELEPLLADAPVPAVVPDERLYTIWAWFSGRGVRTWLHYDNNYCHNINAQLVGKKHCRLFSPSDLARLAPFPLGSDNPAFNCSQIDVEGPDLGRFPDFASVESYDATLAQGDLLFIPACWFHSFLHLGDFNANVNYWYKPERPSLNPVAVRQRLIDCASQAGLDLGAKSAEAALLGKLDAAATRLDWR